MRQFSTIEIRQAELSDLDKIKSLVRPDYERSLEDELTDQALGLVSIFVAWVDLVPKGYSFVAWNGCRDEEVRKAFPRVPEIYRLTVEAEVQSQSIGSRLIKHMESVARSKDCEQIGLGVAYENPRAHALYLRLGYTEILSEYFDKYIAIDSNGQEHEISDKCRFMSKSTGA
jgi:ribosomal protein S18 acetylase RimI-like enzyme